MHYWETTVTIWEFWVQEVPLVYLLDFCFVAKAQNFVAKATAVFFGP